MLMAAMCQVSSAVTAKSLVLSRTCSNYLVTASSKDRAIGDYHYCRYERHAAKQERAGFLVVADDFVSA
ncbi:hypothetical protein PI124_g19024 [Phytophthora idaei]|nr:hypothetical protein PI125_g19355 [Phytophthora idaei]KAG3136374.1 hypothetical protein PI126_g17847 [Phytophthora idaei]KAG3235957.1 hypothetical protein PI124_g19024 [Phytophthora idaei]